MSPLLHGLNPQQLAAVTLPAQHALILAGAGSGKTRVLITRIAWLIQTGQVGPHGVLAVTFTNKAAKELLTRLSAMLPINTRGMWIGTFHGLCNRLLRAHYREAGLPQLFQILDSSDQLAAIKRLLKNLNVDDEKFPPRELQYFINAQKEAGLRPTAVEAWDDYTRKRVELYREYEAQCQREGVVDFAELLLRSYELLERNEIIRRHYQTRFSHILVDEFQDTNVLQYRWLKLLASYGERSSNERSPAAGPPQGRTASGGAAMALNVTTERPKISSRSEPPVTPSRREGPGEGSPAPAAGPPQGRTERGRAAMALNVTTEHPEISSRSEQIVTPPAREGLGVGGMAGGDQGSPAAGPPQGRTERGGAAMALNVTTERPEISSRSEQIITPPAREGLGVGGSKGGARIFAVGDDDQSIYAFRGADVGNMRDFEREFRVDDVIRLEQNYRSHGNILDAANAIIKNNAQRLGKNLWTDAGSGEPIRIYEAVSDGEEARWIVEEVKSLSLDGMARREIALLYRSNAQSRILEHALFSAGVPYRVYGGLRFFERQEIKHALAYLRLIANADDDGAFMRVVNFPTRGIGARSLEVLQDAAKVRVCSLYTAVSHLSGKAGAALGQFVALIAQLKAASEGLNLSETIEQVLEQSGLRAHYLNDKEGQDRLANLDELVNAGASFIAEEGVADAEGELTGDLAAFLSHASLEAGEHQAGEGDDALQLMTMHAAKGLEFDAVFINGLEEGLCPHENAVKQDDGLEEERRLMYVAVTRARRRLYISFAQTRMLHGQTRYNLPSRFLDEIPPALLKWLTPPRAQARSSGYRVSGVELEASGHAAGFDASYARADSGSSGLRVGQTVAHAKFGQGVILNAEGSGSDARVQVNFGRAGVKWLALSIAKLTPLA